MHIEIQVALNFLISFLYNKLPRRRVNQFGEELEQALKNKFSGHWYPSQPAKGSAYRCLKTQNPLDPVFEIAARNCGLEITDVQEYLPSELTIWVEPGEVSYRMSEKSPVKLLYQENEQAGVAKRVQSFNASEQSIFAKDNNNNDLMYNFNNSSSKASSTTNSNSSNNNLINNGQEQVESNGSPGTSSNHSSTSSSDSGFNDVELAQRKVRSFNPEAQCFKPIESSSILNTFNNSSNSSATNQFPNSMMAINYNFSVQSNAANCGLNSIPFSQQTANTFQTNTNASSYFTSNSNSMKSPNSNVNPSNQTNVLPTAGSLTNKQQNQMTVGMFAATKFGSTKLKTTNNSSTGLINCGINGTTKRNYTNRMSPTEFSNYIKQRALLQQQQQQQQQQNINSLSLNGHQLQVPQINGTNNFSTFGLNNSLFNGLSPQQSRSISPNQDFLLMAAASAVSNNGTNQVTNNLNTSNLMRTTLTTNNTTSPISATAFSGGLNSTGNSVCSSLSSNSGSTSLKLMLNNQTNNTSANLLSPTPNSAPSGENLLGDINYLSELFNNTSLSPILGNSASLNNSSQNLNCNSLMNSSLNTTMNSIKQPTNTASMNRQFNPTTNSFLDNLNANNFGNYNSVIGSKPSMIDQFNNSTAQQEPNNQQINDRNQQQNNPTSQSNQQQLANQNNSNNQNSPKSTNNNEKQFNDSYSVSNGVIYPNQYQHLLVAN